MTVIVEFWESLGEPGRVQFGLERSATLGEWTYEQTYLDLLDQVPWGLRPDSAPETVRLAGALLRQKLAAVPSVNKALVDAFNSHASVSRTLFFRVCPSPTVEAVPFEVVWDKHLGAFVCLDGLARWPVARIPGGVVEPPGPFTMEHTVRVLAVLAAKDVLPWGQLKALQEARASQPGLHVETHVLTSSSKLVSVINAQRTPTGEKLAGRPSWYRPARTG